ncbi:MAG TPA: hypothetical protein VFB78_07805 [Acidimicrobiales bacterium]|nr:hypothetical protein [Acidimicrobiales bacterium]
MVVAAQFVPRIEVSALNEQPDSTKPSGVRYRVKVRNRSRVWRVGDVSLHVRVIVVGWNEDHPTSRTSLIVPVADAFPALERRPLRGWSKDHDEERSYTLHLNELHGGGLHRLPAFVTTQAREDTLTMTRLLGTGRTDAFVRIAVAATHGVSGLRRTYTQKVRAGEIQFGDFQQGTVQIVPPSAT